MNAPAFPDPPAGRSGWPWTPPAAAAIPASEREALPRITVVTPSYQQGGFLEATLRSVLLQDYPKLDYIVIDNGSTDGSTAVIRRYAPWLSSWVSEPDRGQSDGINKGFAKARGEILAWLNADDLYLPGTLLAVGRLWAQARFDVLSGHTRFMSAEGKMEARFPAGAVTARDLLRMLSPGIPQPSTFWSADSWRRCGPLDESLHYVMDLDFWLRLLAAGVAWRNVDQELALFRHHPAQKGHQISQNVTILAEKRAVFARIVRDPACPQAMRRDAARGLDSIWVKEWKLRQAAAAGTPAFVRAWLRAPAQNWRCLRVRAYYGAPWYRLRGAGRAGPTA